MTETTTKLEKVLDMVMIERAPLEEEIQLPVLSELKEDPSLMDKYGRLYSLSSQVEKKVGYKSKFIGELEICLDQHGFIKENHYYARVRDDKVDYIFLDGLREGHNEDTYCLTLPYKESRNFEEILTKVNQKFPRFRKSESYEMFLYFGGIGLGVLGIFGGLEIGETVKGLYGDLAGFGTFMGTVVGSTTLGILGGYKIGDIVNQKRSRRYELEKQQDDQHKEELIQPYMQRMVHNNENPDLDIIIPLLELTPAEMKTVE